MIIKVCGMRNPDNISAVAALGVDMIGFIFFPQSPRYVQMISAGAGIIPDYSTERLHKARSVETVADIENAPKRVGVFVDDMPQNIVTRVYNYNLDYIQLHGNETRETCENLRRTLHPDIKPGIKIIKAISIGCADDIKRTAEYEGAVDMFLFDTSCDTVGGSGNKFNWELLQSYTGNTTFLLSGGISADDACRVRSFCHPRFAGIDVNSCFETEPGIKDVEKLREFINEIRL